MLLNIVRMSDITRSLYGSSTLYRHVDYNDNYSILTTHFFTDSCSSPDPHHHPQDSFESDEGIYPAVKSLWSRKCVHYIGLNELWISWIELMLLSLSLLRYRFFRVSSSKKAVVSLRTQEKLTLKFRAEILHMYRFWWVAYCDNFKIFDSFYPEIELWPKHTLYCSYISADIHALISGQK